MQIESRSAKLVWAIMPRCSLLVAKIVKAEWNTKWRRRFYIAGMAIISRQGMPLL